MHGSPGPPPGFAEFAAALRRANASRELVRNRRRWSQIYSASDDDDDDSGDDTEAEDVHTKSDPSKNEEELWEEEDIESVRNEPSSIMEDDGDREENYAMPSRSGKRDQNPFAHWEWNN